MGAAVVLFFAALAVYVAPWIIAVSRNHPNMGAIVVVNLFLGWTFIGWVVALAWSVSAIKRPA
jgi:hypothetical protein